VAETLQVLPGRGALAIVAHDAGGAEILSSYVRRHALSPLYVLDGPARKVFERKLGPIASITLDEALDRAESLLCSTSWQSDLEFDAIKESKKRGKPSAAFLDHWVNYRERFARGAELALPDQIWVGDPVALKMARETFPGHSLFMEENPYFLDIKEEIAALGWSETHDDGLSVLYVCEPIKGHAKLRYGDERHWGYVEEDALRYFLNHLPALGRNVREIRIRPHPSEQQGKYAWASDEFSLPIAQGGDRTLLAEIAASDVVVGCESMAMVIGLLAGKRVISSIPPGGRKCVLPQNEIQRLENLVLQQGVKV
jgi:hypothetical protein